MDHPAPVLSLQKEWGYELKPTNAGTPQENGLVECIGGVFMDRARAILLYAGLPVMYIGDAVQCVVHTYNLQVGRKGVRKQTFYDRPVRKDHLQIFGSLCFVYDNNLRHYRRPFCRLSQPAPWVEMPSHIWQGRRIT